MKITKFDEINNTFSFSVFKWDRINLHTYTNSSGTHTFNGALAKSNIFFAENGSGKSNIIKIIKSLNGESIILERHRDNSTEAKNIIISLDSGLKITYTDTSWDNELKDKFIIFDKYFIDKFVYTIGPSNNETPQIRQQRGRNIVYLGDFVHYQKEIDRVITLKNTISARNNNFLQKERVVIQTLLNEKNISLADFEAKKDIILNLKKDNLPTKEVLLRKKQDELDKVVKALKEKTKIKNLTLLSDAKIEITIEEDFNPDKLFGFTVSKGLQKTLHKISHKREFIREGLHLIADGSSLCPFCEQNIKTLDYLQTINDYRTVFDEAFSAEEKKARQALFAYHKILENLRDIREPVENITRLKDIKQFVSTEEELTEFALTDDKKEIIRSEIRLISEKQKTFLDKIQGSQFNAVKQIVQDTTEAISAYNAVIKKINDLVSQLKKDLDDGKLIEKKETLIEEIKELGMEIFFIRRKEDCEKYFIALGKFDHNNNTIEALERIYQALKEKIVEKFDIFVTDFFDLIKNFIKEISPAMEIFEIGGESTYDRRNLQDPAQCGFKVKYNGQDCLHGLSEGEKQVIALAFFFAQLKKEIDKNKIIILDDPITSFDAGKRKSTAELISRETQDFDQLFLFTCDPLFREYCLKQITNDRNFYYIFKTKGSSSIHYVPRDKETIISSFETEFGNIDLVLGSDENIVIYGQKLRFCLETKIKEKYLGYSEDNLSSIINKVASGATDLTKLVTYKDMILQIYSYCNTGGLAHYPRDGATSWNELKGKIKQYLSMRL